MVGVTPESPLADIFHALTDARDALRQKHEEGMGGIEHVRAQSDAMDAAIGAVWDRIGSGSSAALVALGGYGRGELSPHSDIDLMVLHDGDKAIADVSQQLFYALWDAGFKVGHATRTLKECLRIAKDELEAETSFLEPRLVAGDRALFERFQDATVAQTRKHVKQFIAGVREMMRARHVTGGSATSQLEPNLKEGAGGLRDLHVLRWFDRVVGDLADEGLVGAREAKQLDEAAELLHRVRTHLHYVTDHPTDVLLFQHQAPTAIFLGYEDRERPADDAFMRDLFHATRAVEHVVQTVVLELSAGSAKKVRKTDGPFAVQGGRVVVVDEPDLRARPERALELFTMGAPPGAAALRWLEDALAALDELPWTDEVRRAFFRLLRSGHPAVLEAADHAGVFGRLIPEWDHVRCQPQRNVYHGFTVDAHLFNTVMEVNALARDDADPLSREALADTGDPDLLLLAALLHDVGKGTDEDHSLRGEKIALQVADRVGLDAGRRATLAWLVRNHLLLVESATRRDLNDENLVVDIAEQTADPDRARLLYLLSVADSKATGPTAWSPWKASLVAELFSKVLHVLERGELASRDATDLVRLRSKELRAALTRFPEEAVETHLSGVPRAYLLAFPTQTLIRHFALMAEDLVNGDVRIHVSSTEEPGVYEFTLVARDRPGLFAKASGVLALNGASIVDAQCFTRSDGVALEVYRCVGAFDATIDPERWRRVEDDLRRALKGRLSLEVRLAEKRQAYAGRVQMGKREAPKVIVDNGASDFMTVVEIHAPDRLGLLYDITTAMAEMALDIKLAKIATYGHDVVDVFYVRDLDGQKIADPEHVAEVERSLLHRLAPDGR